jgi:hypothetical protein
MQIELLTTPFQRASCRWSTAALADVRLFARASLDSSRCNGETWRRSSMLSIERSRGVRGKSK